MRREGGTFMGSGEGPCRARRPERSRGLGIHKAPACPSVVMWPHACHLPQAGREAVWAKSHPEARSRPHGSRPLGSRREHHGTPAPETPPVSLACGGRAVRPGVTAEGAAWWPGPV